MRIEGHRIWITLFIAIFIVSGYLYYSVRENQRQLTDQSIRSLALTKNNFAESWENRIRRPDPDSDIPDPKATSTLRELLDMMRSSDFFDVIIVSDIAGKVLISDPDISMESIPPGLFAERQELGIIKTGMNISAKEYQVFRAPVSLELVDEPMYLYGAVSQERYSQAGWQISFTVLYLLGSLVIFIIVSYPILRVVGMGRGDTLLRSHVYQVGLSIILLSLFIGFSVSYFSSRAEIVTDQHNAVTTLADSTASIHRTSIRQYASLLELHIQGETLPDEPPPFNEIITIDSLGVVTDIIFRKPEDSVATELLPNLSERYYFQRARVDTFFLGSHFSYLDGVQEGVLSTKVKKENNDSARVVQAITFSLEQLDRSDRDSFNPKGLKYVILNERGEKYYQSPYIKTVIPDLWTVVRQEEWIEIRALMNNNPDLEDALEIPLSFEGQSYTGHLTRFYPDVTKLHEPFWILTLRDKNLRYLRSFSVFMYSAAGYFFLVFILLIISLFSYLNRRPSHYLNIKPFSFDWLRPSYRKRKNYLFLLIVILLHTIFFLYMVSRDFHNFWFVVLLFCVAICFIALYAYLLLSDFLDHWEKPDAWVFPGSVFVLALLLLFMAYLAATLGGDSLIWIIIVLFLFQMAGFGLLAFMHSEDKFRTSHEGKKTGLTTPEPLFALTFTLWAAMIGLFPGYAIHHFAFHYEDEIWQNAATFNNDHHHHHQNSNDISHDPHHVSAAESSDYNLKNDNPDAEHDHDVNEHHHAEQFWSKMERGFFSQMEYQRRQWLGNYTGIDYPVIDRYIYASLKTIRGAKDHDDHTHGLVTHQKGGFEYTLKILVFLVIAGMLFLLIRNLTRRIFLTHFWEFEPGMGVVDPAGSELYIITLDNRVALKFLGRNYLRDKEYRMYDFAGKTIEEIRMEAEVTGFYAADGFILLNIERPLQTPESTRLLIDFISNCHEKKKFVVLTGARSMKELREEVRVNKNRELERAIKNWHEASATYITIILPINYDVSENRLDLPESSGNRLMDLLAEDITWTPHEGVLADILLKRMDESGTRLFLMQDYEKFLLIIQRYNKAWYQNIWEKLSFREKQMVYNYANEGFVNHCNFDVLTELLQKGVFRMDLREEKITLFNRSFCNFATRAPSEELLEDFSKDKRENGNLKHLRNAMLTFVFLAILGVSLVAPELLDRYIGAISGGLAILSTLASALGKFSIKTPFFKGSEGG